jgi:hypothetical protein
MLAKVDVLSFWKKYQPRAPVVDKISAITLLEGFSWVNWRIFATHMATN